MPKGVKIKELELGTGRVAERGMLTLVRMRLYLNHGREIPGYTPKPLREVVDLGKRHTLTGIRYGIEGMKAGGRRHLVISPHLACGAEGIPGVIPPDAVLHCEVELLEVHPKGSHLRQEYRPGRQLFLFHPGVAAESIPRWQFWLHEDGDGGVAITRAHPSYGWGYPSEGEAKLELDPKVARSLIEEALAKPEEDPEACLSNELLWSDTSEKRNGATRDQATNTLCISVSVYTHGSMKCHYALKNDSPAWLKSRIWRTIGPWLQAELARAHNSPPAA